MGTELNLKNIPLIKGIYFIFTDEELVYIGKSNNIVLRILTHFSSNDNPLINYSDIKRTSFIEVEDSKELHNLEKYAIRHFKPKWNRTGVKTVKNTPIEENLLKKFKLI